MNDASTRGIRAVWTASWLLVGLSLVPQAAAQTAGTAFTYQGRLSDAGSPANGPYDFQLVLYTAAVGGSQVGPVLTLDDVAVVDGLFTANLDFGLGAFDGDARFLEIGVRPGSSSGAYTLLGARQELTPAPHTVFSQEAPWTGVSGKPPGFADDTDDDALGGLSCTNGQVAKWNGAAWACSPDDDTTYSAGAGLDLAGTAFSVEPLGITTAMLADGAVNSAKILDSTVTTADIAADTITAADIAAGGVGSSEIADASIALADLGQNGCAADQVLKWNGAAWACSPDDNTTYSAGAGLDLAGSTFSVEPLGITTAMLADGSVNSAKVTDAAIASADLADNAVTSAKIADASIALADLGPNGCAANQVMKWTGAAWNCAADANTTYTAGSNSGLVLNNTVFGLMTCSSGQVVKAGAAAGTWFCASDIDTNTTYTAAPGGGLSLSGNAFSVIDSVVARKDAGAGNQAFDTSTLMLDYTNNRVGVNTAVPTTPLDVNGTARASAFTHNSTQTGTYYVSGNSFIPFDNNDDQWRPSILGYGNISAGVAPYQVFQSTAVHLPNGATVTSFVCHYYDNDAANGVTVDAALTTRLLTSTAATSMAGFVTSTTAAFVDPNVLSVTDSTINNAVINTVTNAYFLAVNLSNAPNFSGNQRLYGCGITYTYTTLVN